MTAQGLRYPRMRHVAVPRPPKGPERNSLGGHAFLAADIAWPLDEEGKRMVLFFQFDVRPEFGLALAPNTHIAAFMSPTMNEIHSFEALASGKDVPERFWDNQMQHFRIFVFGPDAPLVASPEPDPYLEHQALDFVAREELGDPFLAIGGEPKWYQDAETHPGFDFIGQLSENFPFRKRASAPEQPNTFSDNDYCLFLGNSIYLFARPEPRDPREIWIVLQN